jgi:excisionase family DNA binding protein
VRPPQYLLALSVNSLVNALDYIGPHIIRAAIESGELPSYMLGAKKRILVSDVEAWIRAQPRGKTK